VRTDKFGGAWCPLKQATAEPEEWIQIDLKTVHMITATETQGRFGNGQGIEYAEAYMIEYWRPRLQKWIRYHNAKGEEVRVFPNPNQFSILVSLSNWNKVTVSSRYNDAKMFNLLGV